MIVLAIFSHLEDVACCRMVYKAITISFVLLTDYAPSMLSVAVAVALAMMCFWTAASRARTETRGSGDCSRCDDVPVCIAAGFSPARKRVFKCCRRKVCISQSEDKLIWTVHGQRHPSPASICLCQVKDADSHIRTNPNEWPTIFVAHFLKTEYVTGNPSPYLSTWLTHLKLF